MRAGRGAAITFWETRLIEVAHGKPGNAQSIQWALRNRSRAASGWHHDSQKIEHTGPDGGPVAINAVTLDATILTPEQRDQLRKLLMIVARRQDSDEDKQLALPSTVGGSV